MRIATVGWCQVFALGNLAHLFLHHVSDGEQCLLQLPVIDLCQKVCLVLDRIRTGTKPFQFTIYKFTIYDFTNLLNFRLRIMTCGYEVVFLSSFFVKGTELDEFVAHHVRIRRQTSLHLVHRVFSHLIPVFPVTVNDLQLATILMADSCCHLQVLFTRTVPFLFFLRTNLDIETVRLQPLAYQFVKHHTGVHAPTEQYCDFLIFQIHAAKIRNNFENSLNSLVVC